MFLQDLLGSIQSQYHERGGIGIGGGTVICKYGGRKDVVLYRIACLRVYGVGILLSVLIVEVAVVAAGGHCDIAYADYILDSLIGVERIIRWLVDSDAPWLQFLAVAVYHDLSTYLYHEVLNALFLEESRYHIGAISLGYGRAVEHRLRILLDDVTILQGNGVESHDGTQAVDGLSGRRVTGLETESPGIHHRRHGDIEGSVGFSGNLLGELEYLAEHLIYLHLFIAVDAGDDGGLVEWGK